MNAKLKILPLGGLGEVGKNMTCIEYGRNLIVIDAGIMFPEADMPGVDYLLPDWSYVRENRDRLRAVLVTHGHLDHIGGLAHFLREFQVPVYATRLTRGLIETRLEEERMRDRADLHTYAAGDAVRIGPFTVEPYHVCHSIPDSVGLGITTPAGLIVVTGDFKLDPTPVDGWPTDTDKLAEFAGRGVLALLADSTNAERPGTTPSEAALDAEFDRIMSQAPGRLIIATFASLISRIQQVVNAAERHGRRVAIAGRSMIETTEVARELGYLHIPAGTLSDLDEIKRLPANRVVILATGSQGEPMAVLGRLATGKHASLSIEPRDTVMLSSHTIPGNEEMASGLINRLLQQGTDVIYDGPLARTHVSGHASQDELTWMIDTLQPRFFVPVHGELRHLVQHARLAAQAGIARERIAVVENGYPLTLTSERIEIGKRLPNEPVLVDGSLVGQVGPALIKERDGLGQNGFVTAIARYDRRTGKAVGRPRIVSQGFVPHADGLLARAGDVVRRAATAQRGTPPARLEEQVQRALSSFFYRETRSTPVVTVALIEDAGAG